MGALPSTPRRGSRPSDVAEYLIGTFVGEKSYPLTSDFWQKLLELPITLHWPENRILLACEALAQNNRNTRHMAKILVHLVWSLQEVMSADSSTICTKAVNAAYMSSMFLKFLIENAKTKKFEELYLSIQDGETTVDSFQKDEHLHNFIMHGVFAFISSTDVSSHSYALHHELLNFLLVAFSTQLRFGTSVGLHNNHPFLAAAISQDSSLVCLVVRRLLLNYLGRTHIPFVSSGYSLFNEASDSGVLKRVGSVAANFVLLPYFTFNYLVSSSGEGSRSPLADNSILVLLVLIHYRKRMLMIDISVNNNASYGSPTPLKENLNFSDNSFYSALQNARDVEFDRLDVESNAQTGPLVRLPFASLFDMLSLRLSEETSILLLYSLVHGNSDFLEYVLVRIDLDTLLMPILETLYNAPRRTSNQIYMSLIILLILSQDSSFNSSIHKLMLPSVPWYQERLLSHTSLGSLMVVILTRTAKYNLSKLRDVYLQTNCLATLANMAPHVHKLSAYASQSLVSLFDMLSRKYMKLAEYVNDRNYDNKGDELEYPVVDEDVSPELHIYTDFLRIVLEIINAILTYALVRNPEVVYAIMHRQEVFQPFKNHPRFHELLENIYTVLDFFNSRMNIKQIDGEWSVDKVLQIINVSFRSWRTEGMKMFTQLRFTYEQENHPEEFFIPYVWQLVLSKSSFSFNPRAIALFDVVQPLDEGIPDGGISM